MFNFIFSSLFLSPDYGVKIYKLGGEKHDTILFYVFIPLREFFYKKNDSLFITNYRVVVEMKGKKKSLIGDEILRTISTKSNIRNRWQQYTIDSLKLTNIADGKYKLYIAVENDIGNSLYTLKKDISFKNNSVGDIIFYKNGIPKDTFTSFDTIIMKIASLKRLKVLIENDTLEFNHNSGFYSLPLNNFKEGVHNIKLFVNDEIKLYKFWIENPFYINKVKWDRMVDKLIYVASRQVIEKLKQTPQDQREVEWIKFWEKFAYNNNYVSYLEAEEDYFRKIEFCEEHFRNGDKGYRSDRAVIYMKYGEPDDIEEHLFEPNGYPYIVWKYSSGYTFVFVDKYGFGEFKLQNQ